MGDTKTNSLERKRLYLAAFEDVVKEVGEEVLNYQGLVSDTAHIKGHEQSSIDIFAYEKMLGSLERRLCRLPPEYKFKGSYLFEQHELQDLNVQNDDDISYSLRIDEIDGTTNAKRALASSFNYAPSSAISIALCKGDGLNSVEIGAVYDLHNRTVFSGMQVEDGYLAYCERKLLNPELFIEKKGDSSTRIMVVGYSNTARQQKATLELAILAADKSKKDYRPYDGCRSSANDILSIIRNQYDAYVDARALWGEDSGAMLYPYDIAGIVPVALGCNLKITDLYGNDPLQGKSSKDPIHIVVARPQLHGRLIDVFKELEF